MRMNPSLTCCEKNTTLPTGRDSIELRFVKRGSLSDIIVSLGGCFLEEEIIIKYHVIRRSVYPLTFHDNY